MADYNRILTNAVKTAFSIGTKGKLVVPVTLKLGRTVDVDPVTDKPNNVFANTVQISAFRTTVNQVENNVTVKKDGLLIQAADLPAAINLQTGPVEADTDLVELDGEDWIIYEVQSDPLLLTYTLLFRKS